MHRCAEIDFAHLVCSKYFSDSLHLLSSTLELVNSADLNQSIVNFLTYLLNSMSLKYRRQSVQVQQIFMQHYGLIIKALMITIAKPNISKEIGMVASAFQNAINWAEQAGFEGQLKDQFMATFIESEFLKKAVSAKLQQTIVFILFGLRRDVRKLRVTLVQLHQHLVNFTEDRALNSGEEAFIGLELQAQEAVKTLNREAEAAHGEEKRVTIDLA